MAEDYLLRRAHWLAEYVTQLTDHWKKFGYEDQNTPEFYKQFGKALSSFATIQNRDGRPILKTPSLDNLDLFPLLFPDAHLILVMRDGRDVVESYTRSFRVSEDEAIRRWTEGAARMRNFSERYKNSGIKFTVVRYEQLYQDQHQEMLRLLEFLELDPARYNFDQLSSLPVIGSSDTQSQSGGIHWGGVAKSANFNPLGRSTAWSRWQHERFNWITGDLLTYFGYEPKRFNSTGVLFDICNRASDVPWFVGQFILNSGYLLANVLLAISGKHAAFYQDPSLYRPRFYFSFRQIAARIQGKAGSNSDANRVSSSRSK